MKYEAEWGISFMRCHYSSYEYWWSHYQLYSLSGDNDDDAEMFTLGRGNCFGIKFKYFERKYKFKFAHKLIPRLNNWS